MARIVQAPRAAAILYHLLQSRADRLPWLLPANICAVVPLTFAKARVPFELVDISPTTLHLDWELAAERLRKRKFGGLLYAHTYGEPSTPTSSFSALKAQYPSLMLIDDRCLCRPDIDAPPSSVADVVLYSTGYAKQVDLGFGGFAHLAAGVTYRTTTLPFAAERYDELESAYKASVSARTPFRYQDTDWLQTDGELPTFGDYRARVVGELESSAEPRALISRIYASSLPAELQLPRAYQSWRFNLRVKDAPRALSAVFAAGLFASNHYASLAGVMAPGRAPHAETLASQVVNLFIDRHFSPEQAERLVQVLNAHLT